MNKIFILAGNYAQAQAYARSTEISPSAWSYVSSAATIKGTRNAKIIATGSWYCNKDIAEISDEIMRTEAEVTYPAN